MDGCIKMCRNFVFEVKKSVIFDLEILDFMWFVWSIEGFYDVVKCY